jgi:hypothetical protein
MILQDELQAQAWVRWLTDLPDGTQLTMPSIGEATVFDMVEDENILFEGLDKGEFNFTINEYIGSATYITDKNKMDSYYANQLIASFLPAQQRAIMEHVETSIFNTSAEQTANDTNSINGYEHRFVGSGTNEVIAPADFAKAKLSLKKANVPMSNLVAFVDPTVAYTLETTANLINFSDNPRWEGIVETGLTTGMRFIKNVFGFDVYESNYLADANETIGGVTTAAGKANIFFSAASRDVLPIVGAWRQMPEVEYNRNVTKKRDEYSTTAYYDTKLFREENFVCVLTDTDQV